jgi:hypothetical protein
LARCQAQNLADNQPAYSRGGVAVVKSHYPFSRAYRLAEGLSSNAKELRGYPHLVALDWHFAVSGLVSGLKDIRDIEYTVRDGKLHMRPVRVGVNQKEWRTWPVFLDLVTRIQTDEDWAGKRNKVKTLRESLRGGPQAVESYLIYLGNQKLPPIPDQPEMETTGWSGGICGYFDAVEAMDFFIPLEGGLA